MSTPRSLLISALLVSALPGLDTRTASGQSVTPTAHPVVQVPEAPTLMANSVTGSIHGVVIDDRGEALDGVVVSALGSATAFAVTDAAGRFTMPALQPGAYLLRAHLQGYLPARSTMVDVRPSGRTESSFRLRREGMPAEPRIAAAGAGGAYVPEGAAGNAGGSGRDESETAWRLRRLKRSVLKDSGMAALAPPDDDSFLTDPFEMLGRAMEQSARAASALFADLALEGQVNIFTTSAFDSPSQAFELDRTRRVAFVEVGAPVGAHGGWGVRAALNQSDLSSWTFAGNYLVSAPARRYELGLSYSKQGYEGGNPAALAAVADGARNVGSVFGFAEVRLTPTLSVGYGARFAHYDYLEQPSLFSPRFTATISPTANSRIHATMAREFVAPGAEEFLPPQGANWLPPQRTFSPLSRDGFRTEGLQHYEIAFERIVDGVTLGVRAFRQNIDDQAVTLFGLRPSGSAPADVGHYFVATAGDAQVRGLGFSLTHALASNVRGSVEYSIARADWIASSPSGDLALLSAWIPSAVRSDREQVHDVTTSLETAISQTSTRVFVLYKFNNAFVRQARTDLEPGLDYRFDVQVSQSLPFLNFLSSEWEMLVGVRNVFREGLDGSLYDELLVARPPKRVVGGLTVKF